MAATPPGNFTTNLSRHPYYPAGTAPVHCGYVFSITAFQKLNFGQISKEASREAIIEVVSGQEGNFPKTEMLTSSHLRPLLILSSSQPVPYIAKVLGSLLKIAALQLSKKI